MQNAKVNSIRLKESLLNEDPGLTSLTAGRDILIMKGNDAGSVLSNCHETTLADGEAVILAKAASILRRHIFQYLQESFIAEFSEDSLIKSVPSPLFAFIKMTLLGPNIESQISVVGQRDKVACSL